MGTSIYRGVSWDQKYGVWKAVFKHEGKQKHLGHFDNEVDAAKAWNAVAAPHRLPDRLNKIPEDNMADFKPRPGHKPKPFQRPSIELAGANSEKKHWRKGILVAQLEVGDLVADRGRVTQIEKHPETDEWWVHYLSGKIEIFSPDQEVFAFTKAVR